MQAGFFIFPPEWRGWVAVNNIQTNCEPGSSDILMMSTDDKLNLAKAGLEPSPVWCAHEWTFAPIRRAKRFLATKGFGGGVPPNTETTAVKPRVGSAS